MSKAEEPLRTTKRAPLLIENIYEKETAESFVERHFRNRPLSRCRCTAEYDLDAVAKEFRAEIVRTSQDLEPSPNGKGFAPLWALLLIKRPNNVFWHFLIKSGATYGTDDAARLFTLTVTAESPEQAAADAEMLRKNFTADKNAPGFFMIRNIRNPQRIPLKPEYALSDEMLDLHYGAKFAEWASLFAAGLAQNGLSILRGKPGTGKTSFLRHLIYTLTETHRFYYIPVDSFGLLQAPMTDFLTSERRKHEDSVFVLVLEDAEQLLLNRRSHRDGLASTLLNFTDGFVGDMVKAHLICTINSDVKDLDDAVLRPGRQRFFREFELLAWPEAEALAAKLNITLTDKRSYSLAELYHYRETQDATLLREKKSVPIGFNVR